MTISNPSAVKCPEWNAEIPPANLAEFQSRVSVVSQDVAKCSILARLSADDARRWHHALFQGYVPLDYYAGNFRSEDVARPCLANDVAVGNIAGVPFQQVITHITSLFSKLCNEISQLERDWPSLMPNERAIRLANFTSHCVGWFIRIHPFLNGNGRISRLIWRWCLMCFGIPTQFRVQPRPATPYSELMEAAMRQDFGPLFYHVLSYVASELPSSS